MPIYEYHCSPCGNRFEELRPMGKADDKAICLQCSKPARRVLTVFAAVVKGGSRGGGMDAEGGCCMSKEQLQSTGGCGNGMCGL